MRKSKRAVLLLVWRDLRETTICTRMVQLIVAHAVSRFGHFASILAIIFSASAMASIAITMVSLTPNEDVQEKVNNGKLAAFACNPE